MADTDPLTWLGEREAFSRSDAPAKERWLAKGHVVRVAPAMLAVVAAAERLNAKMPYHDCRGPSCVLCGALPDALGDFYTAVREEQQRHGDR